MLNLESVYYDTANPAGFSSVDKLKNVVSGKHSHNEVIQWLQAQEAYTLHKSVRKHFKRKKYIVSNIDDLWQADLNDMRSLSKYNDGINYLLIVIDVFSKYAWIKLVKTKKQLQYN